MDITTCEYTIDGNIWQPGIWNLNHCESTYFTIILGGVYQFNTRAKDNIGNLGTGNSTITYLEDVTAPDALLYGLNDSWNNNTVTLDLNCEGHKSGCKSTTYRVDYGSWVTTIALSTEIILSTDGNHVIDYYSTDNLDTSGSIQTSYMAVDKTAPTTTDNTDGQWHSTDQIIT